MKLISRPRMRRISCSGFFKRSEPSKSISPETTRAAGGSMRKRVSARVVLPEPDSPTMPSVWP